MPVNNKLYFKAYNNDFRSGGVYADLDSSELCVLIKLHAYADESGVIWQADKSGYRQSQLTNMINLNPRTIKKSLLSLQQRDLISIADNDVIVIKSFIHDQDSDGRSQKPDSVSVRLAKEKAKGIQQGKESTTIGAMRLVNDVRKELNSIKGGKKNG